MNKLSDLYPSRNNNFDFIRFILSILVVFSHSFNLVNNEEDFIGIFTNENLTIGSLCVFSFFIISGFLVIHSYIRYNNIIKYCKARFFRIYPGLITVVLISAFIIGPMITVLPFYDYITNLITYKYILFRFLPLPGNHDLPGIFLNNIDTTINGSLWSIAPEIWCYIGLIILGILGLIKKRFFIFIIWTLLIICIFIINIFIFNILEPHSKFLIHVISLIVCYLSGCLIYLYRNIIFFNYLNVLISLLFIFILLLSHIYILIIAIFMPYLIFHLAFSQKIKLFNFAKFGDFSYGIYIYSFLIQQLVYYFFIKYNFNINILLSLLISYPIILLCAFLSWHLVEKRFILYNRKNN